MESILPYATVFWIQFYPWEGLCFLWHWAHPARQGMEGAVPGDDKVSYFPRASVEEAMLWSDGQLGSDSWGSQGEGKPAGTKKRPATTYYAQGQSSTVTTTTKASPALYPTRPSGCTGVLLGSSWRPLWSGFHHRAVAVQSTGSWAQIPTQPLCSRGILN